MSIWDWLGLSGRPVDAAADEGLDAIEGALASLGPERARYLACFAYILTRGARADHEVTNGEMREMERLVADRGHISPTDAAIVVQLATRHSFSTGGSDDFGVTRQFNAIATHEQKLALIDCLFAVSSSDRAILTVEDNEIRRVARELRIEHGEFITIRSRYRDSLEVLRKTDPP